MENQPLKKSDLHSSLVWLLGGVALIIYCIIGLSNTKVPGVQELVSFLSSIKDEHIYIAGFLSILVEGLYVVGSFFPGSTLIAIIAILSQIAGPMVFLGTILSIFVGWCVAGAINIFFAKMYHKKIAGLEEDVEYQIHDRPWTTWFPAFRANYEVAQVTAGGNPFKVFFSSVRVKIWASIAVAVYALVVPLFIDIKEISNEEGFASVLVVAAVSLVVGGIKLKKYLKK